MDGTKLHTKRILFFFLSRRTNIQQEDKENRIGKNKLKKKPPNSQNKCNCTTSKTPIGSPVYQNLPDDLIASAGPSLLLSLLAY
jgi:hypothetical protein